MPGTPILNVDIDMNGRASYFVSIAFVPMSSMSRPSVSFSASSRPGSSSSVATVSSFSSQTSDGSGPSRPRRLPPSPANTSRRVRPLPSVPATPPCECTLTRDVAPRPPSLPRTLRPLPSLPELSVTRAPSPAPSQSSSEGDAEMTSGHKTALSLDTTSLRLAPSRSQSEEISPVSPTIPEPPTPSTARRRRMSKLRRHLGERPPSMLVPAVPPLPTKAHVLAALQDVRDPVLLANAIETAHRVLELEFDSTGDAEYTDSDEEDSPKPEEYAEEATDVARHRVGSVARPTHKYSKKWLKERRGRKRETVAYQEVLDALRVL
ncbi:hypothetical protein HDZ31DRAFT_79784 [Schizophyllum fasciatum]